MLKERYRVRQLEYCNKQMFGNLIVTCPTYASQMPKKLIQPVPITVKPVITPEEIVRRHLMDAEKRRTSLLVDQLLLDIHNSTQQSTDYNSTTSGRSSQKYSNVQSHDLFKRDLDDLSSLVVLLGGQIERVGVKLVRRLKRREALRRQQEANCHIITCQLKKFLPHATEDMRFTVNPQPGESGFSQWVAAMKMVAQLPGGIPPEFRKRLWLTMAEKHLASKGVDWARVERTCFSEWSHPDDGELGVQIVKDLHRTGCSLFCGEGGQENQALLKKVLLAYARWNKAVGYCQGFNMLAALILQVTDKSETDALKLMIYLIEGVLPDSYFADSLRGLSVDMAVFRELLRTKLPRLSKHLDLLQNMAKEGTTSYEPPLTNVFTMQWFLTLFCNCLPQPSVLRIWDLILLEGNEILLRTALAIWQSLADRIMRVKTADEFYCIMGLLTNELLENNLIDANTLVKAVVTIGPLTELKSLREHYLYNINPWGAMPSPLELSEKQLKLYPRERLALDISALKKQYLKLKQRQKQAHIIFTAAISRQPPPRPPVAMNHLLLGKSALVPAKRLGPPKGSIPPARIPTPSTLHWKDTSKQSSSSSSSDTELCDDNDPPSDISDDIKSKSPCPDLPEDNPPHSDTSNLMNKDNIVEAETSETMDEVDNQKSVVSDIFDSLVTSHSDYDVEKVVEVDSEDDSVDFELFLEDRIKCLKQDESPTEEEKRVNLSRRNSERALQIIQENSLILHRILQCQSRLSLSPPSTETLVDTDDDTFSKKSLDSCRYAGDGMFSPSCSSSETNAFHSKNNFPSEYETSDVCLISEGSQICDLPLPKTPDNHELEGASAFTYGSKYSEILEKSRTLNDKYHDLIDQPNFESFKEDVEIIGIPESKTFTNQEELIDFSSCANTNDQKDSTDCEKLEDETLKSSEFVSDDFSTLLTDPGIQWFENMESNPCKLGTQDNSSNIGDSSVHKFPLFNEYKINESFDPSNSSGISLNELDQTSSNTCSTRQRNENIDDQISDLTSNYTKINNDSRSPVNNTHSNQIGPLSKSPFCQNVWSENLSERNELCNLEKTFGDISVSLSSSRIADSSEEINKWLKNSATVSDSISVKDFSSAYEIESTTSNYNHSYNYDRSLSTNNFLEKTNENKHKRSLSDTYSMKNKISPSPQNFKGQQSDSIENYTRLRKTIISPDMPREITLLSPSRSLLGSSSLRNIENPNSDTHTSETLTFSSRLNSSSIESNSETFRRLSPMREDKSIEVLPSKISAKEFFFEDKMTFRRINSPQRNFETHDESTSNRDCRSYGQSSDFYREVRSPLTDSSSTDKFMGVSKINPTEKNSSFSSYSPSDKDNSRSHRNMSPLSTDSRSPINDSSINDRVTGIRNITSPEKTSEIFRRSSPMRREDKNCADLSYNYRESRSPLSDTSVNERSSSSRNLTSPERFYDSSRTSSPFKDDRGIGEISPKSPSKIFNPFPVPLSSRQNKEVAVKLGLYKK